MMTKILCSIAFLVLLAPSAHAGADLAVCTSSSVCIATKVSAIDMPEQSSAPPLSASGRYRLYVDGSGNLKASANGGAYSTIGGGPWAADTNGISYIGNVGIGTTSNVSYSLIASGLVGALEYSSSASVGAAALQMTGGATYNGGLALSDSHTWSAGYVNGSWIPLIGWNDSSQVTLPGMGETGVVLCVTSTKAIGHCTAAAACTGTCTCTCAAN